MGLKRRAGDRLLTIGNSRRDERRRPGVSEEGEEVSRPKRNVDNSLLPSFSCEPDAINARTLKMLQS